MDIALVESKLQKLLPDFKIAVNSALNSFDDEDAALDHEDGYLLAIRAIKRHSQFTRNNKAVSLCVVEEALLDIDEDAALDHIVKQIRTGHKEICERRMKWWRRIIEKFGDMVNP